MSTDQPATRVGCRDIVACLRENTVFEDGVEEVRENGIEAVGDVNMDKIQWRPKSGDGGNWKGRRDTCSCDHACMIQDTVGLLCTLDSCPLEASQQKSSVEGECHDTPNTSCREAAETWQKVHNAVYVHALPSCMWYGSVHLCSGVIYLLKL